MIIKKADIPKLIEDAARYAEDGWSFNVCMSKCGHKNQTRVYDMVREIPQLAVIKKYCEDRRNKYGFMTSQSIYAPRRVNEEFLAED